MFLQMQTIPMGNKKKKKNPESQESPMEFKILTALFLSSFTFYFSHFKGHKERNFQE